MRFYLILALIAILSNSNAPSSAAPFPRTATVTLDNLPAPPPEPPSTGSTEEQEAAHSARKLVNANIWGVVSSIAYNRENAPFGNVLSYSDGGIGTPYFYLTTLDDATANYSLVDPRSSLTVSEYALGTCKDHDPQEPPCEKVTLAGELRRVKPGTAEAEFANATLFDRHPRFKDLPKKGMFEIYKLVVRDIFLINSYIGSPKYPSKEAYFKIKL